MADKNNSGELSGHLDFASLAGLILAMAGILGGLFLEGGRASDVAQVTAALIVLGGTLGAVMLTTPSRLLFAALRRAKDVFWETTPSATVVIEQLLEFARQARRSGIVSLERDADALADPFLRKALSLAVDGTDLQDLRRIMELEIELAERRGEAEAKVFETAGGYAPTIGIIGAVLGLIQVMKHLEDIERVGHGIAVAFVATVYGIALANLVLLPAGNKLKARLAQALEFKELMLEGVIGIAEGMNPKLLERKLEAFLGTAFDPDAAVDREAPVKASSRAAAAR
ncbi:MAG TPA: flagellar motor protein [Bryobacteraceae bacterium]|nr:flagellar motor protein [Bryobacteraceae bacterium]